MDGGSSPSSAAESSCVLTNSNNQSMMMTALMVNDNHQGGSSHHHAMNQLTGMSAATMPTHSLSQIDFLSFHYPQFFVYGSTQQTSPAMTAFMETIPQGVGYSAQPEQVVYIANMPNSFAAYGNMMPFAGATMQAPNGLYESSFIGEVGPYCQEILSLGGKEKEASKK
jgi:hypothetical protein